MSLLSPFQVEKQKVGDAINVVCDRLEHATLLQDRRTAVLSLKGFAREYKETVTAGGLRGLLKSLSIDREDEETLNATLKCLLILFTTDTSGHADDTALWIADEFTLRPENVHNLIDIVADSQFHTRLRALQIMACILECRAQQLQECVMNSPTGTSTLVGVLDESREHLRNEGLLLLIKLVRGHVEIQKRVAFENAFDKVLAIVETEGGLEGGIITTDAFTLLYNLLSGNASNQNWFRETGFLKTITNLLQTLDKDATISSPATIKNAIALLRIARVFLLRPANNRVTNQQAFLKAGFITQVIGLTFSRSVPRDIRTEALLTAADSIYCNAEVQEYFAKACALANTTSNSESSSNDISALLRIVLEEEEDAFALRYAAMSCIESFASGNRDRKLRIVETIIAQYKSGTVSNLLESIVSPTFSEHEHRVWFACCTIMQLTSDDEDAKVMLTAQSIGDAAQGEEEVSLTQTISACLVSSLAHKRVRSAVAYSMLLSTWLYDSKEIVADFLEEGSTLQAIIAGLMLTDNDAVLKGVLACLLSIAYAFDFSEDSPVNRVNLQSILLRVGRDAISGAISRLSSSEEVHGQVSFAGNAQQASLLHIVFVEFFRDNFGPIRKAVDQPPTPARTRREEEALEEQDRTDDIITELEEELERKSSGLEEAVIIIKTRQEELQRLRDEISYINGKHKVEYDQMHEDLEQRRLEAVALRSEATINSNEIDKCLRETSILHRDLDKSRADLEQAKAAHKLAHERVEQLEADIGSEASKRSFLEKELANFRETSGKAIAEAESARTELSSLKEELRIATDDATSSKKELLVLRDELNSARAVAKKSETEATNSRTRARDLDSDLKGAQQELEAVKSQADKDSQAAELQRNKVNEDLQISKTQINVLQAKIADMEKEVSKQRDSAKQTMEKEVNDLQEAQREQESALQTARSHIARLEKEVQQEKDKAAKANKEKSVPKENGDAEKSMKEKLRQLETQVDTLTKEKTELQKQLEQAQEDLMLLMEDEADGGEQGGENPDDEEVSEGDVD